VNGLQLVEQYDRTIYELIRTLHIEQPFVMFLEGELTLIADWDGTNPLPDSVCDIAEKLSDELSTARQLAPEESFILYLSLYSPDSVEYGILVQHRIRITSRGGDA